MNFVCTSFGCKTRWLCIDFGALNATITPKPNPLHRIDELLYVTTKAVYLPVLNLHATYQQEEMYENGRDETSLVYLVM